MVAAEGRVVLEGASTVNSRRRKEKPRMPPANVEDLRDRLWNAKLDKLQALNEQQSKDIAEIKQSIKDFTRLCSDRHSGVDHEIRVLSEEMSTLKTRQHGMLWAIGAMFSALTLALFEWIFGGLNK